MKCYYCIDIKKIYKYCIDFYLMTFWHLSDGQLLFYSYTLVQLKVNLDQLNFFRNINCNDVQSVARLCYS